MQVRQAWDGLEMEVELLRRFGKARHPYLPAFYGVAQDREARWYLVSEYFPLGGLDVQLEIWEGRLSLPVKLCIGQQVCEVRACLCVLFVRVCVCVSDSVLCVC